MIYDNFFENNHILHVGTESPRAYYIPCDDASEAMDSFRESSSRFILLNGDWHSYQKPWVTIKKSFKK